MGLFGSNSITAKTGSFTVPMGSVRDINFFYQWYESGNGREEANFVGWLDARALMANRRTSRGYVVHVAHLQKTREGIDETPDWYVHREQQKAANTTVETTTTFEGSVLVYEWGRDRKNVRLIQNGRVVDAFYEANGKVYSFYRSDREWRTMRQAIESVTMPEKRSQGRLIDGPDLSMRRRRR